MGKKSAKSKKPKTSVKIQNKSINKLNRRKKNKPKSNKLKEIRNATKGTNKSLAQQRAIQEHEENSHDEEEEEVLPMDMLDDENLEYFSNNFSKKRKDSSRVNEDDDCTIENNYKPKVNFNKENGKMKQRKKLLPIKDETGLIEQYLDLEEKIEEVVVVKEEKRGGGREEKKRQQNGHQYEKPKTMAQVLLHKKLLFENTKDKIGLLCRTIMENPQGEVKKLKELRTMLTLPDVSKSNFLKKLIIISLTEIFKDILPGFKIRIWSDKENEQQVSSDVKDVKDYEHMLVKQYKLFIDYLDQCIKDIYKNKSGQIKNRDISSAVAACKCLNDLITKFHYFNHSTDIIQIIVNQSASKYSEISEICCECVQTLFKNDNTLETSFEITKKISKLLKQRSFGVKPEVLNTMLALNLKEIKIIEEDKKKLTHKEKMKLSRTDRKKLKEQEQLEIDLDQRKLSDKLQEKSKHQTHILEHMFLIYFKILKTNANLKLIPSVLEGLAKFAHLISLEFFDDLITVLHQMVEQDSLTFRAKLHCVKTVFVVLSGQGEALTIDPLRFYTSLYNIILNLNAAGSVDNTILLLDCIEMMFFKRRKQIPQSRLLAFIKRLSIITLQLEPKSCALIQHTIRRLLTLAKSSDLLFDVEYQFNGIYNAELTEPDYANAQNTVLWECHLLTRHFDSIINSTSMDILKQTEFTSHHAKITNEFIIDEFIGRETEIIKTSSPPLIKHKNNKKKKKSFNNKKSD